VRVAIADGKVAAVAAFAEHVGISLITIAKNATTEVEHDARSRGARGAVADALGLPPEACQLDSLDASTGTAVVSANGARIRVQTARQKDAVVATTLCETV
jgi:hypothetical protein